jgi:hypothetical protein
MTLCLYDAELAEKDLEDAHTCIAALVAEMKALKVILELCFGLMEIFSILQQQPQSL